MSEVRERVILAVEYDELVDVLPLDFKGVLLSTGIDGDFSNPETFGTCAIRFLLPTVLGPDDRD